MLVVLYGYTPHPTLLGWSNWE